MRVLASLLLLTAAGFAALTGPAAAQSAIKIVVNGLPITNYDITQRTKLLEVSHQPGGVTKATDDLINEAVQMSEFLRRGGAVPTSQIDGAYAGIATGVKMTPEQLNSALGEAGVSPQTLKLRIKAQIAWSMLVQAKVSADAKKTANDVTTALQSDKEKDASLVKEYVLQQIIFITPKGTSSDAIGQRRREAEAFRGRFKGCDSSVEQVKALKDVVVKEVGRRDTTQISEQMATMLKNVPVGKTTAPNQGDNGIELIAVCSVRDVTSTAVARDRVENKLALAQGDEIGKDYLKELRSHAIIQYR